MSAARPAEILRQLAAPDAAGSDGELLHRFAASRDHAAFAELVRRHGPLVLTVCRKVAGHPQDAEDAFQAVFLVLARKAATLSQPERLGNWLYGVAVRVAQRARRTAARRRAREVQVTAMPDPPSVLPEPTPDIGPVLHEELNQLPSWYRDAVLLCDLQGVSRSDAAKTLGIAEGTLSSRLATGRKKLAERLAKRGITLAAAALPMVLGEGTAFATVPDSLIRKTCGLVADWAVGAVVPAPVHTLAAGGFTMRKMLLFGLVAAAITVTGIAVMAQPKESAVPIPVPNAIGLADAKPDQGDATIPGENAEERPAALGAPRMRRAFDIPVVKLDEFAWTPDGKGLAVRDSARPARPTPQGTIPKGGNAPGGMVPAQPEQINTILFIPDISAEPQEYFWHTLPPVGKLVGFTPDGKELIVAIREYGLISGFHKLRFYSLPDKKPLADERGTLKLTRTIELEAEETFGYAFAPDGKTFRTVYRNLTKPGVISVLEVREIDAAMGRVTRTLAKVEGEFTGFKFADNGSKLAVVDPKGIITVFDAATGAKLWATQKPDKPEPYYSTTLSFSPDGTKLLIESRSGPISVSPVKITLVDAETGVAVPVLEMPDPVRSNRYVPTFSMDSRLLAISGTRITKSTEPQFGQREQTTDYLCIWDTATGKTIKSWNAQPRISFLPNAPVLAIFESNQSGTMRLGLWDFAAEAPAKK